MRLALLLFLAVAAFAATVEETCQRGQFLSSTGECEDCRECGKYMYTRKQCTQTTNTVCGWCGSKTIVQTEDFETKCEPWKRDFDMLGQLKKRIQKQMEKKMMGEDEDVIIKDLDGETHIVEIKSKKNRNELDEELPELPLPDNWEREEEIEYDSQEYDDYEEDGLDEISLEQMRKELNRDISLPKPVVPSKHIMEKSNPVKVIPMMDIERMHTSEEIEDEIKAMQVDERDIGEEDSDESEQGEVIEIVNPRAEIARLPMRIIVTADRDSDSYEDENVDESFVVGEEESLSRRNIRILYRIIFIWLLILIVFAVLRCYLSKRAARYHFVMLPQQGMTREQEEMINRCAEKLHKKKVSKEAHCYENQIAYV